MDIECEPEVVDLKPDTVKIEVKRVDQELAEKEKQAQEQILEEPTRIRKMCGKKQLFKGRGECQQVKNDFNLQSTLLRFFSLTGKSYHTRRGNPLWFSAEETTRDVKDFWTRETFDRLLDDLFGEP